MRVTEATDDSGRELGASPQRSIRIDPTNPRGIVWLASFPRSGNTWARIFLTNLRRILRQDTTPLDLDRLEETFSFTDSVAPLYQEALGYDPISASPEVIATVRPKVLERLVRDSKGTVLLKTHNANVTVFGVRFIQPELTAGAVYLVRNPLDVVVSNAKFRDISIDQAISDVGSSELGSATNASQVFSLISSWSVNVMTWTAVDDPTLLVVRYEDMVERPTETFRKIATHVLMNSTPEQLTEAIERSAFSTLRQLEERTGFNERLETADRFFREGRVGQWQEVLTPAQVDRVIADHREQMARFGYLPQ